MDGVNLLKNPNFTAGDELSDVVAPMWWFSPDSTFTKNVKFSAYFQNKFVNDCLGQSVRMFAPSHWGFEMASNTENATGCVGCVSNLNSPTDELKKRVSVGGNESSEAGVHFSLFTTPITQEETDLYSLHAIFSDEVVSSTLNLTAYFGDKWGIAELDKNQRVTNVIIECGFGIDGGIYSTIPRKEFVLNDIQLSRNTTYAIYYRRAGEVHAKYGLSGLAVYKNSKGKLLKPSFKPNPNTPNGIAMTYLGNLAVNGFSYEQKFRSPYPIKNRIITVITEDYRKLGETLNFINHASSNDNYISDVYLNTHLDTVTQKVVVSDGNLKAYEQQNSMHGYHVYLFESSHPLEIGFWDFMKTRTGYKFDDKPSDSKWRRSPASDNYIDWLKVHDDV